jgi:hypothetical protein
MTVLQALATLEDAVLECKQRNVDTPEVTEALDFLEPHIRPAWLVPQYRSVRKEDTPIGFNNDGDSDLRH